MLGLGNWVDNWKNLGCKLPIFHSFFSEQCKCFVLIRMLNFIPKRRNLGRLAL